MLSTNQIKTARDRIESTYDCTCDIVNNREITKTNGANAFEEFVAYKDLPCKLSFKTIAANSQGQNTSLVTQIVKLFISPDVKIEAGSKVVIKKRANITEYKQSGEAAIYPTHQEIMLMTAKEYA